MIKRLVRASLKANYIGYTILFVALFGAIIFFSEKYFEERSKLEAQQMSKVFATPLWRFDTEAIRYYLLLTISNDHYYKISIRDQENVVVDSEQSKEIGIKSFFYNIKKVNEEITYRARSLGTLEVIWKDPTPIFYLSILFLYIFLLLFKAVYSNLKKNKLDMEQLFKQSFDYNASVMSIIDYQTHEFVDVNKAFLIRFKYSRKKDVVGKKVEELGVYGSSILRSGVDIALEREDGIVQKEISGRTSQGDDIILLSSIKVVELESKTLILFTSIDVTNKRRSEEQLAKTNRKLIESARVAGQAEIATGVLHNVGNVLNSACISASVAKDSIDSLSNSNLVKIVEYLEKESLHDSKIIEYIKRVDELSKKINQSSISEMNNLMGHLDHIREIVKLHQSYSRTEQLVESVSVDQIIEDAIRVNQGGLERHGVRIEYKMSDIGEVLLDRHRVLQVLINLVSNAKYATSDNQEDKVVRIEGRVVGGKLSLAVCDNGKGISKSNIKKLFTYGFTTRSDGHGFGLHSCANVVNEMNGEIRVESDGEGKGARFEVILPLEKQDEMCA